MLIVVFIKCAGVQEELVQLHSLQGVSRSARGDAWELPLGAWESIAEFTLGRIHLLAPAYLSHSSALLFVSLVAHGWYITSRSQLIWFYLSDGRDGGKVTSNVTFLKRVIKGLNYLYTQKRPFSFIWCLFTFMLFFCSAFSFRPDVVIPVLIT